MSRCRSAFTLKFIPNFLLASLLLLCVLRPASAATFSVPGQFTTIQAAINAAANGDTVVIADGTYTGPGNVDLDFGGRSITVTSQNGAVKTIIDCGGTANDSHRGFNLHSGETNAIISGLTIQNGDVSTKANYDNYGGGIYASSAYLTIQNCIIRNNKARYGGGVCFFQRTMNTLTMINCFLTGNSASIFGGGINITAENSPILLTNCTFTGNIANRGDGGISGGYGNNSVTLVNDILYGDAGGEIGQGTLAASYCDIQGGYQGTGNINADPLFTSVTDFHLQPASPCLAAGTANGAPVTTLDGRTRPSPPSIGAYEQVQTVVTLTSSLNPSVTGRDITFTASIPGRGVTPTGTVTFTIDGTKQQPVPVSTYGSTAAMAFYVTSSLPAGSHTITAIYSGDGNLASGTSAALTEAVAAHVSPQFVSSSGSDSNSGSSLAPKLTIQAALNASLSGDTVVITDGIYTGLGNVDLTFGGQNIIVTSQSGAANTVIDCGGSSSANHRGFMLNTETSPSIKNGYEDGAGGAILNYSAGLTVDSCIISSNTASEGGGIYSDISGNNRASVTNCVISGNSATSTPAGTASSGGLGGGILSFANAGSLFSVIDCTVIDNSAANAGGGIYIFSGGAGEFVLTNDIFFGDAGGEIAGGSAFVSYCDVQGGFTGTSNINLNPHFVNDPTDLHLEVGSPCFGAGTTSVAPTTTIDGHPRSNPPSIGAYEGNLAATMVTVANISAGLGQTVTMSATLSTTSGQALSGKTLTFTVNYTVIGSALTNSAGVATLPYAIPAGTATGNYTITAFFTEDSTNAASYGTSTLTVTAAPPKTATSVSVPNQIRTQGQSITLTASLKTMSGTALGGQSVSFTVDGVAVGSAATNSSGTASVPYTIAANTTAGSYPVKAVFAGDATHTASSGTGTLTIKYALTLSVPAVSGTAGTSVTLSATLAKTAGGAGVSGKTLAFVVDGKAAGSAVTNSAGGASLSYAIPAGAAAGSHPVTVSFNGAADNSYTSTTGSGTLSVMAANG